MTTIDLAGIATTHIPANDNADNLSACRGLLWATVISAPLWGGIVALIAMVFGK